MDYKHLIFSIISLLILGFFFKKIHTYIDNSENKDNIDIINKYMVTENKNIKKLENNNRPKIWIFLNNTINSQKWETFGSRNTNKLNKEYINLCISSIINKCGKDFDIMLIDVNSFKILLDEWNIDLNKLSDQLRKHYILLGLIQLLKKFGGFIIEPNTIMFRSLISLYNNIENTNKIVTGEFKNYSLDYYEKKMMPSTRFLGSNKNNKTIIKLENYIVSSISKDYTKEIDAVNLVNKWLYQKIIFNEVDYINGKYLGTKDNNNNIIDLEDLLSDKYLDLHNKTYFLHIPDEELSKRHKYNWFIYLSKKEILDSRTNIGKYLKISYN